MSNRLSESVLANQALFAALPEAARAELEEMFGELGRDVLEMQRRLVPVGMRSPRDGHVPGQLKAALTVAEAVSSLRVRIGLPEKLGRRSRLFYAVIQHYGRKAQRVMVTRGDNRRSGKWRTKMVNGRAVAYKPPPAVGYEMDVPAMPGIPFVHGVSVDAMIEDRLSGFWDRVQGRAGG